MSVPHTWTKKTTAEVRYADQSQISHKTVAATVLSAGHFSTVRSQDRAATVHTQITNGEKPLRFLLTIIIMYSAHEKIATWFHIFKCELF